MNTLTYFVFVIRTTVEFHVLKLIPNLSVDYTERDCEFFGVTNTRIDISCE